MNKKKMVLWGTTLLIGLILTGCAGHYGGYGDREYPYRDRYPFPFYNCPNEYGVEICPH